MYSEKILLRNSIAFFSSLFLFSFWGFWTTYFSHLFDQPHLRVHVHGLAMLSWLVLLVLQPLLIRSGNRALHRTIGKLSYVLVPIIVVSTLSFAHSQLAAEGLTVGRRYLFALQLALLIIFVATYGLAIFHRRTPMVHARYMVCTGLALVPPILDRILFFHFPERIGFLSQIGGIPLVSLVSFSVVNSLLVMLLVWDWRRNGRLDVFPAILGLFISLEVPVYVLHRTEVWTSLSGWFLALPLS